MLIAEWAASLIGGDRRICNGKTRSDVISTPIIMTQYNNRIFKMLVIIGGFLGYGINPHFPPELLSEGRITDRIASLSWLTWQRWSAAWWNAIVGRLLKGIREFDELWLRVRAAIECNAY